MSATDIAAMIPILAGISIFGVIAAVAGCYWIDYAHVRDSVSSQR